MNAWDGFAFNRLRHAQRGTGEATARLVGMKLRAKLDPPRAATGGFPYPARTCAEWKPLEARRERKEAA